MKFRRNCFGIIVCPEYVYVSVIFASNKDKVSLTKTSDWFWLQSLSKITNSNDELRGFHGKMNILLQKNI